MFYPFHSNGHLTAVVLSEIELVRLLGRGVKDLGTRLRG